MRKVSGLKPVEKIAEDLISPTARMGYPRGLAGGSGGQSVSGYLFALMNDSEHSRGSAHQSCLVLLALVSER